MSNLRRHKIEMVKNWINKLSAFDSYCANAVRPYNGDELDRMTLKQIEMLLDYIQAVYHFAYRAGADVMRERKGA